MTIIKYDIPLLDRNTRFSLWHVKIRDVLAQLDLNDAIEGFDEKPVNNGRMRKNVRMKSLTNKLHLKQHLYLFKLAKCSSLEEHPTTLKENVSDLETLEVNIVKEYDDGELLIAADDNFITSDEWILDSGSSFRMSTNHDWFATYETVSTHDVFLGNNVPCKVAGIGTIKLKMFDEIVRTLGNVRHVPDLSRNLISLGTLDSKGYKFSSEGGAMKIYKDSLVILKG
ncbi:uncharacterized protein LOC120158420 [Hibiscus syriacus]|uniref:uncharacterized protein LOC120158420 n=1 Tax=Hibiscus syriacus TaxID=106335 RepID=UPI00192502C5|nr:uncharacterized protein LOC120158420 [Hibiscus syriacus]